MIEVTTMEGEKILINPNLVEKAWLKKVKTNQETATVLKMASGEILEVKGSVIGQLI